jgi:hypothetical protein
MTDPLHEHIATLTRERDEARQFGYDVAEKEHAAIRVEQWDQIAALRAEVERLTVAIRAALAHEDTLSGEVEALLQAALRGEEGT